ncbi:hypothetical protein Pan153_11730 [Gimesia panareensis]|uniref:Uncharacterized protein n=1 Tax=Gimesia panareensis TaxID=2527978 RepID=A0A518FJS9_9PLAN|nr:hypothetical protein [Gimesia panareensis]QDV16543.1 hypothetical protein Pan153_11730 [Gimesia panareensis]
MMGEPEKIKTIKIIIVNRNNGQKEQIILKDVMEETTAFVENQSPPIDTNTELQFEDDMLAAKTAALTNKELIENQSKTHSEVLDTDEYETEDSGSVKTSLKDYDFLELIAEISRRCLRYVASLTQKGYRIAIKKCEDDGQSLNDKFKQ